jgi:serine/threonine protein phosphatase PrpC
VTILFWLRGRFGLKNSRWGAIVSFRNALSITGGRPISAWAALVVLGLSMALSLFVVGTPGMLSRVVQSLTLASAVLSGVAFWAAQGAATTHPDRRVTVRHLVAPEPSDASMKVIDLARDDPQFVAADSGKGSATTKEASGLQHRRSVAVPSSGSGSVHEPPRFGPGSKAQRREWVLPKRVVQSGVACDAALVGDLTMRAASIVGPGHRCEEPAGPRQDAYAVVVDSQGGHFVAAVADGVSSSRHAEVGAHLAASSAAQLISAGLSERGPVALDVREIYQQVAHHMSAQAAAQQWHDADVCAALITGIVPAATVPGEQHRSARLAWVGDASAWILREGRWACVAGDRKGDDDLASNDVRNPLPFGAGAVETAEVTLVRGDLLVLVTDGVGDGLATLPELRDYLASHWRVPVPVSAFLDDVGYDAERFLDDRTAVSVWVGPVGPVGAVPGGAW